MQDKKRKGILGLELFRLIGLPLAMSAQQSPQLQIITGVWHAVSQSLRDVTPELANPAQQHIPLRHPATTSTSTSKSAQSTVNDSVLQPAATTPSTLKIANGTSF